MIVINKNGKIRGYDCEPSIKIKKDQMDLYIWGGMPYIYIDHPFDSDDVILNLKSGLEDIVPYMAGNCFYMLSKDGIVQEVAADYYGHSRIYYSNFHGDCYISEDWRVLPHETNDFNLFQLMYFLNWDLCFDGETYFEDLKYFSPTYKYRMLDNNQKIYMRVDDLQTESYHQAIRDTLNAIKESGNKAAIMLSGGMDSAEVALAAKELGMPAVMSCSKISDYENYDNIQDCVGARIVAEELGFSLDYAECEMKKFLDGWNGKLSKYVAFSYKDGRLWQSIAKDCKKRKANMLINGNHADYMLNFGFTKDCVVREIPYGKGYFRDMREVTMNSNLKAVFRDNDLAGTNISSLWDKYNHCQWEKEKFLAWCISIGNYYPCYSGMVVDLSATEKGKNLFDEGIRSRMRGLIDLYNQNEMQERELVLEGLMLGEMDGENCRAITGASYANGLDCFIIHASPLVFDASRKLIFDETDIDIGKKISQKTLNDSFNFRRVEEEKSKVSPESTFSSSEMWEIVYDLLNEEFDVKECSQIAKTEMLKTGCFDISKIEQLAENNIGVKLRLAWLGYIYSIYCQ